MSRAVWLGLLAGFAVAAICLALVMFLTLPSTVSGLLLAAAFFLGPIAGLGVYGSLARRAMGLPADWDPEHAEVRALREQGSEITMTGPFVAGEAPLMPGGM